jgi:hypothetical protein
VSGITPDVLVPWSKHDSAYQRAEKMYHSLLAVFAAEQANQKGRP